MLRRNFIRKSGVIAIGLASYGNIRWSSEGYIGDSITTSDILGPFYRPGAPLRTNLNPQGFAGEVLHLSGTVYQNDNKTPVSGCKIEIWQCKADGYYDNLSDDYCYRAYSKTGNNGKYHFITVQPPPEPTDETKAVYRPAHIHLRFSALKQQDLITQIYFNEDPLLASDPSTKSSLSIKRILQVKRLNEKNIEVRFDVVMGKARYVNEKLFRQVCGMYKMNDGSFMEFYRDEDLLFYRINGQIWGALTYHGNTSFTGMNTEATFMAAENGNATVHFEFLRRKETRLDGTKILNYGEPKVKSSR